MPSKRPDKKGSFGGHLDELVTVLEPKPTKKTDRVKERIPPARDASVPERLFESAWCTPREERRAH